MRGWYLYVCSIVFTWAVGTLGARAMVLAAQWWIGRRGGPPSGGHPATVDTKGR